MKREDIRLSLESQIELDYSSVYLFSSCIQDLYRTDVPTFLVTIVGGERRIYSLTHMGKEEVWISRSMEEYQLEEKERSR